MQRITIPEILADEWFKKDYKPPVFDEKEDTSLDDVEAVFKDCEVHMHTQFLHSLILAFLVIKITHEVVHDRNIM